MCKVPNCRRLLSTLRCRYSWNQGNANIFVLRYLSTLALCYLNIFQGWLLLVVWPRGAGGERGQPVRLHWLPLQRPQEAPRGPRIQPQARRAGSVVSVKLRKYYNISPQPSRVTSSAGRSRAQLRTSARWPSRGTGRGSPWWRRWRWRGPASTPSGSSSQASEVFVYYIYCLDTSVILNLKHIKELLL